MKKITLSFIALFIGALLFASCGGGGSESDMKSAAKGFADCANRLDFDGMKKYSSEATAAVLTKLTDKMSSMSADDKKMFDQKRAEAGKITITLKDAKADGDKGYVTFSASDAPARVDTVKMVKEKGKWVADMKDMFD